MDRRGSETGGDVVLVTGSSSGIGKACCDRLSAGDRRVYGASRKATATERWTYLRMDVTDDASVQEAIDDVVRREGRIDAVVHCAGLSLAGPIESTTVDEAQMQFNTNFFGTVRVIGSVLPVMRKQGSGKIIVIGSIAGLISLPYLGYYSASKFALDGLVGALRREVEPFGIQASVVHPGNFNTALFENRIYSRNINSDSPYFGTFHRAAEFYRAAEKGAGGPGPVARKIESLLAHRRLPARIVIGSPLELLGVWGKSVLPPTSFEFLMRKIYGP
jgi:NAD(P)-dependent dehydrogenase (short-subunit alcohol dehydrogenase family)